MYVWNIRGSVSRSFHAVTTAWTTLRRQANLAAIPSVNKKISGKRLLSWRGRTRITAQYGRSRIGPRSAVGASNPTIYLILYQSRNLFVERVQPATPYGAHRRLPNIRDHFMSVKLKSRPVWRGWKPSWWLRCQYMDSCKPMKKGRSDMVEISCMLVTPKTDNVLF